VAQAKLDLRVVRLVGWIPAVVTRLDIVASQSVHRLFCYDAECLIAFDMRGHRSDERLKTVVAGRYLKKLRSVRDVEECDATKAK
jgi:hypothetical protein